MRILVPFGTRPEIVKLAPVVRALRGAGFEVSTLATGQHYDGSLTDVFYEQLGLRPDLRWSLEGSESERVGALFGRALEAVGGERPDLVLVLGDTYTVPAFCFAARRHRVGVAHLEAGLRSFNPTSMEETNRKAAAAMASLHFAPTELARRFLESEGVSPGAVRVVGNPVIDVLRELGLGPVPAGERRGVVVTCHRATNVDDPARLRQLVDLVAGLAEELGPVVFPVHPRTAARLEAAGLLADLQRNGVSAVPPLPYGEMLEALRFAKVVVTDSGGLQEEASYFGVPAVVLRRSTPRWEGVQLGSSVLTGMDAELALAAARRFATAAEQQRIAALPCPYGDGHTSERVVATLSDPAVAELLTPREPDLTASPLPV